jgi:DNA-binding NarL/FixJ family response regulator
MKTPCVLVMETDSLLKRAFVSVLQDTTAELLVCFSQAGDVWSLIAEISKINPDIVLFGESMPLSANESLSQIVSVYPALRLIVVSEQSNWLHIFQREDKLLTSLPDFLEFIHSD